MNNQTSNKELSFIIGDYSIHPSRNLVIHGDEEILITPKMLAVLIELVNHQDKTLSKEQLILAVWGTIHTSDMVLSRAISDLRKVFADSARQQHTIETVTKKGYRLKKNVEWLQAENVTLNDNISVEKTPVETLVFDTDMLQSSPTFDGKIAGVSAKAPDEQTTAVKTNKPFVLSIFLVVLMTLLGWGLASNSQLLSKATSDIDYDKSYLTLDDNTELNIRFSPNGEYLAYVRRSNDSNGSKIILQSVFDKSLATVSEYKDGSESSYNLSPTFSPDGKKIAYKHSSRSANCTINIYTIGDEKVQTLAECPTSQTDALDWSPDGKYLVTNTFNYIKKIESLVLVNTTTGINKILLAPTENASGYLWPRFSPDGNSIAVVYFQPNNHLWVIGLVDAKTGGFTEVFSSGEEVSQVVWSEDGSMLYYLIVRSKERGIWQINLSSKEAQLVVEINGSSLDYNRKNGQFVYIEREKQHNIWRSSHAVDGKLISAPFIQNLPQTNYPTLSTDNKYLTYISTESGVDSLWVKTIDTHANLLLFQAKHNDKLREPHWSHDGTKLLVSLLNKKQSRIIQLDMELGNSIMFDSTNNVKMGKWSQDGRFMYWYEEIDGVWHVMEKELSTDQQRIILSHPVSQFDIPDSRNLHYQKIGTTKIHTRLVADLTSTKVKDRMLLPMANTHSWHAHLGVVYYASHSKTKNMKMLFKMDLSSGLVEELYPIKVMDSEAGRTLSVSNDGRTTYYTKLDKYRTDVVLMTKE